MYFPLKKRGFWSQSCSFWGCCRWIILEVEKPCSPRIHKNQTCLHVKKKDREMTGLPSPVPAQTNKTSTSTETHVVKDFLGFLDQQFFLDIKIVWLGNQLWKYFMWELRTFYQVHSFFKGSSCWVWNCANISPKLQVPYCKLPVEPTRMERLKNESDAAQRLHILWVKGKQQHTDYGLFFNDCDLYLRNGLHRGIWGNT